MSSSPVVVFVVGARPNFMKVAPLLRAAAALTPWERVLVHTGQHYDEGMSARFFRDLGIPAPDEALGIGAGTHAQQTGRAMMAIEEVLVRRGAGLVVVVGDVNSTLAAALAAAKLPVPVAHVEAGLRSGDRTMPEEVNRVLTDRISAFCLTPSRDADDNLRREGIAESRIHFVGNIMIDTLFQCREAATAMTLVEQLGVPRKAFVLATFHRPSNVDDAAQLEEILSALREVATTRPVIFPVHPRTRARIAEFGLSTDGLRLIDPVGYVEMLHLQDASALVITDSGGLQEETTVLGVPCLTLRATTERPVTVTDGTNRLVPVRERARILQAVQEVLSQPVPTRRPEYWDGRTAERVMQVLLHHPWEP